MVARWRASGLSQAEFCRQEGLLEWQLSNWKRREPRSEETLQQKPRTKLRKNGIEFAAVGEPVISGEQEKASKEPAKFVPLVPEKEEPVVRDILEDARRTPVAEICFGEVSVRIWRGADQATMRLVLGAVKEFYSC